MPENGAPDDFTGQIIEKTNKQSQLFYCLSVIS